MSDDREALGRLVRETWVAWAREQPDPKSNWLTGWDELDSGQREVDMRIGSAVAVRATRDARLELDELRAEVMRYRAALPACLGALRARLAVSPHGSDAKPYREALMALRGSEDQERTDEKGPDRA
jgi:hypothetical protein